MCENWPLPSKSHSLWGNGKMFPDSVSKVRGQSGWAQEISLLLGWKEGDGIADGARSSTSCQGSLGICEFIGI